MANDYLKLLKSLWHEAFTTSFQIIKKGPVPSWLTWVSKDVKENE